MAEAVKKTPSKIPSKAPVKAPAKVVAKKAVSPKKVAPKKDVFYIIETGGKQYKISSGDTVTIEKLLGNKVGDKVVFDKVLLIDDGKETKVGDPYLKGEKLEAVIESEGRGKKITVIHYKNKTRYRKKYGHRQPFIKVAIQ